MARLTLTFHLCFPTIPWFNTVKILMIAPEPFFEPRGTPFSEYHRIRALVDLGHTVDLVTYPFGRDVALPGLRVFRCLRPPFLRRVGIGPSLAKVPLDAALALTATAPGRWRSDTTRSTRTRRAASSASLLACDARACRTSTTCTRACRSSSATSPSAGRACCNAAFTSLERFVIRRSRVVIVICPHLEETVRGIDPVVPYGADRERARAPATRRWRARAAAVRANARARRRHADGALHGHVRGVSGAGSALRVDGDRSGATRPDVRFVLAGGTPDQVDAARATGRCAPGIDDVVIFAGQRPAEEIPAYLDAADVLVSPRSTRHEHAAEDLSVPALGPADRRDAAADAHAGARRRASRS